MDWSFPPGKLTFVFWAHETFAVDLVMKQKHGQLPLRLKLSDYPDATSQMIKLDVPG